MSTGRNSSYEFRQKRQRLLADPAACCVVCGSTEDLHIDHRIPVAAGGTDDDDNLQVMCAKHNLAKGKKIEARQRAEYFNERWFGTGFRI